MPIYSVRPTIDTVLQQQSPNSNGNGAGLFTGIAVAARAVRSILHFDLGAMPRYATVDAATLTINCVSTNALIDIEGAVHRLTQPAWSETLATWNNYDTAAPWVTPGGDYDDSAYVQWLQPTQNGVVAITGMLALVLDALAARDGQLHIILKQTDETTIYKTYGYTDREYDPTYPVLSITYTASPPQRPAREGPHRQRGMIDTPSRPGRAAAADRPGGAARPARPHSSQLTAHGSQ